MLESKTVKRLILGRPLQTYEIVDIVIQLADGLDAAHAERIIRNISLAIKPK